MINYKTIGVLIAIVLCALPFVGLSVASAGILLLGAVTAAQYTQKSHHTHEGSILLAASTTVYGGALVFINQAGYGTGAYGAGFLFAGVSKKDYVNSGAAGALAAEVYQDGKFLLTGTGFTQAMVGREAFASDNYTLTTSPVNAVKVGRFVEYVSSTQMWVFIGESNYNLSQTVIADDSEEATLNMIRPGVPFVYVDAYTNNADDFVVLPALASVPNGFTITIVGQAQGNFEVRTPAASNEEINSEDCDGTKEYLFTNTQIHRFVKIDNTIGWMGHGHSAIGAAVAAVVPD